MEDSDTIYNHKSHKYLLLIPILLFILNARYYYYMTQEIDDTLLQQKINSITREIDIVATAAEADWHRPKVNNERNLVAAIAFIDEQPNTYAEAFRLVSGDLIRIGRRHFEINFNPMVDLVMKDQVMSNEKGHATVSFTPENGPTQDIHLYFRWAPSFLQNKILLVGGVSKYSVQVKISTWVSIGQWVTSSITFALNVWLIMMLVELGYIKKQRKSGKWWDGREE